MKEIRPIEFFPNARKVGLWGNLCDLMAMNVVILMGMTMSSNPGETELNKKFGQVVIIYCGIIGFGFV